MEQSIPHSKPLLHPDDIDAVRKVLESGMLTSGSEVRRFESKIAAYCGRRFGAAASSGTAALFAALYALDIRSGYEVVIPAYVCSSLLHAVKLTGAQPVLADSGDDHFHIDYDTVKKVLTPHTRAIIFPHMFGSANDIGPIVSLGIPVIEDCALSLGSELNGVKSGNLGSVASVFSFYTTKVIAAGEGGMVVSDDSRIVNRVRDLVSYDNKVDAKKHFNFTMTDITAALGRSQLSRLESMIQRRRQLASFYKAAFSGAGFSLPEEKPGERHIFYRYIVQTRFLDTIRNRLKEKGIFAERPVFTPLSRYPGFSAACPRAEQAWQTALSLPLYPALTDDEAERVVSTVLCVLHEIDSGV